MRISRQMLGIAAAGMLGLTATLSAQDVEFHGRVYGCFDTGSGCTTDVPGPSFDGNLRYVGDTFDNATLFGGTVPAGFSDGAEGSFGHLTIFDNFTPTPGTKLILHFYFNPATLGLPDPFIGTPTAGAVAFYAASITGSVDSGVGGAIFVTFGSPVTFAYTNGGTTAGGFTHSGLATIKVNDLTLSPIAFKQALTGSISSRITDTPEPATVALIATGLVGLIPIARRRAAKRV